jgi:hypothetical protein
MGVKPFPWKKIWILLGIGVILFFTGAIITFFVLYQPKLKELNALQAQHSILQDAAHKLDTDLKSMTSERDAQVALLSSCQSELTAANDLVARNEQITYASGMQVEVMTASQKLQQGDITGARAALALADQYLNSLAHSMADASIGESLIAKLAGVRAVLETDASLAVSEMDNLLISLHQIVQTLQVNP